MWPFRKKETEIHIENVNVDVDYEKLAEAIVKAQREAEKQEGRPNRFRASLMSVLNITLYVLAFLFSIILLIALWNAGIESLAAKVVFSLIFAFTGVYSVACFLESLQDSDKRAQEHFNSNVALLAMIIALLTLLREMS